MLTEKQVSEIREHLEKSQNPLFFFDNDPDGLCSFLLLRRYLGRGKGVPVKSSPELNEDYFRKINELNPDCIFILDQPEVSKEFFEMVEQINLPVVWMDHHRVDKNNVPEFVNYYNPVFNEVSTEEPITALCYQVTKSRKDIWIGVIGCIADKFVPDFYSDFKKDFPELSYDSDEAFDIYYNSKIGEVTKMFSFGLMDRTTNVVNMLKYLCEVKSPHELFEENSKNKGMRGRFDELYKKYLSLIEKAENKAKLPESEKVLFFTYAGDTGMSADIANRLKYLHPEKVVVVGRRSEGKVSFSIRGKNIREKLLKAIENIPSCTGGGHDDAVGARVPEISLDKFEENLRKIVGE